MIAVTDPGQARLARSEEEEMAKVGGQSMAPELRELADCGKSESIAKTVCRLCKQAGPAPETRVISQAGEITGHEQEDMG